MKAVKAVAARGDESRMYFEYEAVSDDFAPIWDGVYLGMDRENKEIVYEDPDGQVQRFSYAAFSS